VNAGKYATNALKQRPERSDRNGRCVGCVRGVVYVACVALRLMETTLNAGVCVCVCGRTKELCFAPCFKTAINRSKITVIRYGNELAICHAASRPGVNRTAEQKAKKEGMGGRSRSCQGQGQGYRSMSSSWFNKTGRTQHEILDIVFRSETCGKKLKAKEKEI